MNHTRTESLPSLVVGKRSQIIHVTIEPGRSILVACGSIDLTGDKSKPLLFVFTDY